jgi:hypothetical protein
MPSRFAIDVDDRYFDFDDLSASINLQSNSMTNPNMFEYIR